MPRPYQALDDVGIDNQVALKLINALRDEVEFSTLKVGDQLEALFNKSNELVEFRFSQNVVETHVVKKIIIIGNTLSLLNQLNGIRE